MARSYGKVLASIWGDPDWRTLTMGAQHLYMQLLSQPRLSLAGALDLMPGRWAAMSVGTDASLIRAYLQELERARYVVIDRDTEELVIRTLVRHDLDPSRLNKNTLKGLWSAWHSIMSPTLRKVVADNLPDAVWAKSGDITPAEATEMREAPRLELPVQTTSSNRGDADDGGDDDPPPHDPNGEPRTDLGNAEKAQVAPVETTSSNGQSEPVVRTTRANDQIEPPSPSPSPSPAAADVRSASLPPDPHGEPAAAAVDKSRLGTDAGRQGLLADAAEVLARRRATHRPDVGGGWIRSAARGIAKDHHQVANALLISWPAGEPDPTPDELAELLEPTSGATPDVARTPTGERIDHRYDQQQRAMLARAEAGMAQVAGLRDVPVDGLVNKRGFGDARAALHIVRDPEAS